MSDETGGLICALAVDGKGGGQELDWAGIAAWKPGDGLLWVHLDFRDPEAIRWIRTHVTDSQAAETLLADETRPRSVAIGDRLLISLRGVNLNPESDPEDMVSVRMWLGPDIMVTTRHRRILAMTEAREHLAAGKGPRDTGGFLTFIAERLMQRMGPTLEQLADTVDDLENAIVETDDGDKAPNKDSGELRRRLSQVRRQTIELRRYLAPQRDAMNRLQAEVVPWLSAAHKAQLRETGDHITRYVEDMDALRDRGAVVQDELRNRISEDMNRTMYVLTVVAAVLLPLSFVTGLLGINVDGMPGAKDAPTAFWLVTGGLGVVAAIQLWLFRRLRWL
jgi:zinc transporter